jgi:hypothetical protein
MDVADFTDTGSRDEIARLEARIEELAVKLENCRKVSVAARIAIAAGVAIFFAALAGFILFDIATLLASIAAIMGGLVLLGSNRSTADETSGEMARLEAQRAALIGAIRPRLVGGNTVH